MTRAVLKSLVIALVALWPALALAQSLDAGAAGAVTGAALKPCRLSGLGQEVLCGVLKRPLDPTQPAGRSIEVHYAVLPALARNKLPDPIFLFAGGPGQSAMSLAGSVSAVLARAANRRDVVLIDQRGTGRSAPLVCSEDAPTLPLAQLVDPQRMLQSLAECRQRLTLLPHGDLRQYTTHIAMQDMDAVRAALGAAQINVVGGSYGTRAALEYMRQFPQHVRRAVLDGVAPPDMVLPNSFSADNQRALEALFASCESSETCNARYPKLAQQWQAMLAKLPQEVLLTHPVTGQPEQFTMTRDSVLGMVRQPLYVPHLASALPVALAEAAQGRFGALMGVSMSLGAGRRSTALSQGMHFSVVCAEDFPRMTLPTKLAEAPGADFGNTFADLYRRVCEHWPKGDVPAAFYGVPVSAAPVLVLSGGIDPVTPPRHGERVAKALGAKARHVVVANAGHGVMALGCMRDVIFKFIDALDDGAAAAVPAQCAQNLPRPPAFTLPAAAPPNKAAS